MNNQHENIYIFSIPKDIKDLTDFKSTPEYIKSNRKLITKEQREMLDRRKKGLSNNIGKFKNVINNNNNEIKKIF